MALIVYTPTADEVMAAMKEQLEKSDFMMGVAVTDTDDPNWRGGDHINFFLNNTAKGWMLEGSNGLKYKLTIKEVVDKKKEPKPTTPPATPQPPVETTPANPAT